MELGTIEIFALIFAAVAAIKILVLLIQPSSWAKLVKKIYKYPTILMIVSLLLAAYVLNFLLSKFSIVDIFAVILFVALLAAVSMASYSKEVVALAEKMLKDKAIIKKAWLSIIVWIILIIWVLYVLLI